MERVRCRPAALPFPDLAHHTDSTEPSGRRRNRERRRRRRRVLTPDLPFLGSHSLVPAGQSLTINTSSHTTVHHRHHHTFTLDRRRCSPVSHSTLRSTWARPDFRKSFFKICGVRKKEKVSQKLRVAAAARASGRFECPCVHPCVGSFGQRGCASRRSASTSPQAVGVSARTAASPAVQSGVLCRGGRLYGLFVWTISGRILFSRVCRATISPCRTACPH